MAICTALSEYAIMDYGAGKYRIPNAQHPLCRLGLSVWCKRFSISLATIEKPFRSSPIDFVFRVPDRAEQFLTLQMI